MSLAKILDMQTNRKPTTQEKRAGATANLKGFNEEKRMGLPERELKAVKDFKRITNYQRKTMLPVLVSIGQVILDKRLANPSDNDFNEVMKTSPMSEIPYANRKICQDLAKYWKGLQPLIGTKGYTSTSPETLVRQYRVLNGLAKKKGANSAGGASNQKTKVVDAKLSKEQILAMIQVSLESGTISSKDLQKIVYENLIKEA